MTTALLSLFDDVRPSHTLGTRSLPVFSEARLPGRAAALLRDAGMSRPVSRVRDHASAPSDALLRDDLRPAVSRVPGGSPISLDDVLLGAWDGLTSSGRAVSCLVCGDAMAPRWGATSTPVGGRCGGCRSTLS